MKAKHKTKKAVPAGPGKDKMPLTAGEVIPDLPEVKDIPGQEHIHVLLPGELADTTISSDDEEGKRVFDNDGDELTEGDVTPEEKRALEDAAEKTPGAGDEENLQAARLDQRDDDGAPLNEKTDLSGSELDVPGSEDDDDDKKTGGEDEENNAYSLDGEDEDDSVSK